MRLDENNTQRYRGIGELNVQTARGEVKAHPGDLIIDVGGEKLVMTPNQAAMLLGGEIHDYDAMDKTKSMREQTDPQIVKHEGEGETLTTSEVSQRANNLAADGDIQGLNQMNKERGSRVPMTETPRQKRVFDVDGRRMVDAEPDPNVVVWGDKVEETYTRNVATGAEVPDKTTSVTLKVNPDLLEEEKRKKDAEVQVKVGPIKQDDPARTEVQRRVEEARAASMPEAEPIRERNKILPADDPQKLRDLKTPTPGGPGETIGEAVRKANEPKQDQNKKEPDKAIW